MCLDAGMNDHLTKPIQPMVLYGMLARWSGQRVAMTSPGALTDGPAARASALPDFPGLDVSSALAHMDGDEALFLQVLRMFVEHQRDDDQTLRALLDQGDGAKAEMLVHSMKSVAASIGLRPLSQTSRELEGLLRVKAPMASMEGAVRLFCAQLREAVDRIDQALQQHEGVVPLLASYDAAAYAAGLQRLHQLLKAHDGEAIDVFEANAELFNSAMDPAVCRSLRKSLDAFDFDAALAQVELALAMRENA